MRRSVLLGTLLMTGVASGKPVLAQSVTVGDAELDAQVIAEMSFARTRPQDYIAGLVAYRATIDGRYALKTVDSAQGRYTIRTRLSEGVSAVDKAIAFLKRQSPIARIAPDPRLQAAARRFAEEQARTGKWGHIAAGGRDLGDRIAEDGTRRNYNAETIMYGKSSAHDIVMHLIIDDGVSDRSHRDVIFDPLLTLVGTSCRPHPKWMICVSEYSSDEPANMRRSGGR
jgi:uncharacterized protein YkwD